MGFLKGSLKVVSNVVTLGGASRLDNARESYQESFSEHTQLYNEAKTYKEQIERNISDIGSFLTAAKPLVAKSEKILKKSIDSKDRLNVRLTVKTLHNVQKFNSEYNTAIGIGTGTVAGGSLAVGSWALVGAVGSASTGAAISGLSGVAATNATMAWFGGGAMAAGGAGMTGGMAVLGGIVAVPLICIASIGTHKKAREFEEEKVKLDQTIMGQKEHLATLPGMLKSIEEKKFELRGVCDNFKQTSRNLIKIIRPWGFLSAMKQKILMLLRLKPYSKQQVEALDHLSQTVFKFLGVFQDGTLLHEELSPTNHFSASMASSA